jgi:uncharacterized protein YndB with AHSA1/START domain
MTTSNAIRVTATVNVPVEKAWELWTMPNHIMKWNQASDDWCTSFAENNPVEGGRFISRMESRDGSEGFDFEGIYTSVVPFRQLAYVMEDGREVSVIFENLNPGTRITEIFDPENINSRKLQQQGWQAILDSFRRYAEGL